MIFENQTSNSEILEFEVHTVSESVKGRWLVMASGDIDQDGDEDVVIGSNIDGPTKVEDETWMSQCEKESVDILLLLNKSLK